MDKYYPDGDKANSNNAYAYVESQAMMQVLRQCGDDLTRENVMKQAANLKNFTSDMLLPGVTINTSPDDYFPIEADAADAVQRRGVGVVRRRHHR